MDEWAKQRIKAEAEMIRDEIRGGTLYGQPLDESDIDMLIVAAYNAGMLLAGGKLVFTPEMTMHDGESIEAESEWARLKDK